MQRVATRLRQATKRALNITTYVFDSFNRANGAITAADSGQTYLFVGSPTVWQVASNQLRTVLPSDGSMAYVNLPAGTFDVVNRATLNLLAGGQAGLVARSNGSNTYYLLNTTGDGAYTLYKNVAGAFTSLATAAAGSIPTGAATPVALSCKGTTIKVIVGGVTMTTVTDSSISTGVGVGFRHGNGTESYRWDDWTVTAS